MAVIIKRVIMGAFIIGALSFALVGCTLFGFLDSIQVQVGGTTTSSYSFGTQAFGTTSSPVTVTITNNGLFPLTLGGTSAVTVGGTAATDFKVSGNPGDTIAAGGSASFTLTFTPSAIGSRSASITISPSGGGSSTFSVSGMGGGSGTVAVSDPFATSVGNGGVVTQNFYSYQQNTAVFTITNSGTSTLYLTASPSVSISSNQYVTVSAQPSVSVAPGDTTTFTLTYDTTSFGPSGADSESVTVTIMSSDGTDPSFTFTYDVHVNLG